MNRDAAIERPLNLLLTGPAPPALLLESLQVNSGAKWRAEHDDGETGTRLIQAIRLRATRVG